MITNKSHISVVRDMCQSVKSLPSMSKAMDYSHNTETGRYGAVCPVPALGRWKYTDQKLNIILNYTGNLRLSWDI